MHAFTPKNASVATELDTGRRLPSSESPIASSDTALLSVPSFRHNILLPSPPCSPPRSIGNRSPVAEHSPTPSTTTAAPMLQAASTVTTAKLDISLLLKSSPSPPPSSSGAEPPRAQHSRASSVPPISTQHFPATAAQHRPSVSSSATSTRYYQGSRTAEESRPFSQSQTRVSPRLQAPRQVQRPVLPPLSTSSFVPTPQTQRGHSQHAQSLAQLSATSSQHAQSFSQLSASSPQQLTPSGYNPPTKRPAPSTPHPAASPAKRQSKWTPEEDALIIELRGSGMKWEEISKRLPGRSAISCRLHYQNYLERRSEWDEERKNRLARLYERLKSDMWGPLAAELGIPWRAAEAMHWHLGEVDMARRAGVVPFSLATSSAGGSQPSAGPSTAMPPSAGPSSRYMPAAYEGYSTPGAHYRGAAVPAHDPTIARSGRAGSHGRPPQETNVSGYENPPPMAAMTGHGPLPGQVFLPSLEELDRSVGVYEERGRGEEHPGSRYIGGTSRHDTESQQYRRSGS